MFSSLGHPGWWGHISEAPCGANLSEICGSAQAFTGIVRVHLKIDDIAFGGAGVGHNKGKAVFVRFTAPDETVEARIVEKRKSFDRAELVNVLSKSEHRVQAPCPYFGTCGGCDYQHIDYKFQLELKRRQIEQIFQRIAHMHNVRVAETIGSARQYEFRNRITVHTSNDRIGF
ncbi:MAG: class I SAM-dependent RNA methyltransferase, partial [Verrucomicrobia bacterium]|nr:class I SAM-dependent RNA methyltransferase [Verrucomicrobiota bacterium]